MRSKRSVIVFILIIVFGWSTAKGVELLIFGSSTADRMLYDAAGLGWLAVTLFVGIRALDLASIRYLLKPAPIGGLVCLASIALSAVQTAIGFAVVRMHPDPARQAFIVSRESRGLSVGEEAIDIALDPTMSLVLSIASLLVSAILAFLVIAIRQYFRTGSVAVEWQT
jgi:hypothetical protein